MNVFITGATSGIGAALARVYAREGATLGLLARREGELTRIAHALAGTRVVTYAGDVTDATRVTEAGVDFVRRFGPVDIVIANAGISQGADTLLAEDLPVFRDILEVNVLGMVHTFHPFIASMRAERRGTLVGIASIAGFRGLPGGGAYSSSKAAAINYLESLRIELAKDGVAVVTICPGYIATAMTAGNPYRMPFLMDADRAARLIARAIARRQRWYVLPWQMAIIGGILRVLPRPVLDALLARAPRKPRGHDAR